MVTQTVDGLALELIEKLGSISDPVPVNAMHTALIHWDHVSDGFITLLKQYLDEGIRSAEIEKAIFFILHLCGERREARAFDPICRLLLMPIAETIFRTSDVETLSGIIISTYNGDCHLLHRIIDSRTAIEDARSEAFKALAYLTSSGNITFTATRDYLKSTITSILDRAPFTVAVAWALVVAYLGFEDLSVHVEKFFEKRAKSYEAFGLELFHKDLQRALGDPSRMICFEREKIGPTSEVIVYLSKCLS